MKSKQLIIDLCCGGGVLAEAFYDSVGLDNNRKALEYYPNMKVLGDATKTPFRNKASSFVHSSPPCQKFSSASHGNQDKHINIIDNVREEQLRITSEHYCIENVPGAPIREDLILCAANFELPTIRHRKFELSFYVPQMKCKTHKPMIRPKSVYAKDRGWRTKYYFANRKGNSKRNQLMLGCRDLPGEISGEGVPSAYMRYILEYLDKDIKQPKLEEYFENE
ncbi:MAG: hypothetical protein V3V19_11180 [Cocleimonas sp.]